MNSNGRGTRVATKSARERVRQPRQPGEKGPTPIYWAHLDTTYFSFDAWGTTAVEAEVELTRACRLHCQERDVDWDEFIVGYLSEGSVSVLPIAPGWAYRDLDSRIDPRGRAEAVASAKAYLKENGFE